MNDLISRQAAIDAVNNAFDRETLLTGFVRSIAVRAIRDMPSAQPERNKGEWLFNVRGCHGYTCPYCGIHKAFKHNFCPNCGADMRGEQE